MRVNTHLLGDLMAVMSHVSDSELAVSIGWKLRDASLDDSSKCIAR